MFNCISLNSLLGPFMLGAAATAYYINDAATIMPKSITSRIKAFFAGAAADILEVKETKISPDI